MAVRIRLSSCTIVNLTACFLFVGSSAEASSCQLAFATDLPFTMQSGHMAVVALLNDQPTNMWVDTGSDITTLTIAAANRLSLQISPLPGRASGIGGSRDTYEIMAKHLQLGRLRGKNFPLIAANIDVSGDGHVVDGLLGADFLSAYDIDVDVVGGKVSLFKASGPCGRPASPLAGERYAVAMSTPLDSSDPGAHVQVQISGKTLTALFDTGAPDTTLFRDSARRIGLDICSLSADPHSRAGGVGPGTPDAVNHVIAPITIGDLTISHLPVSIVDQHSSPDTDMLLGMDFMSRVHVWFSFSSKTMIMQYPSLPSPRFSPAVAQETPAGK